MYVYGASHLTHIIYPHLTTTQSTAGSDPALFLRILQAEKEGFLSYTLDAPGASAEDEADGYGRRGATEWEEVLGRMERFYQPDEQGPEAMVCVFCLLVCMKCYYYV